MILECIKRLAILFACFAAACFGFTASILYLVPSLRMKKATKDPLSFECEASRLKLRRRRDVKDAPAVIFSRSLSREVRRTVTVVSRTEETSISRSKSKQGNEPRFRRMRAGTMPNFRKGITAATKRIGAITPSIAQGKRFFMPDSDDSDDEADNEENTSTNPDESENSDIKASSGREAKKNSAQKKTVVGRKRASTLIKSAGTQTQAVVRKSAISVRKVTKSAIRGTFGTVQTAQTAFITAANTTADFVQLNRKSSTTTQTSLTVVSYHKVGRRTDSDGPRTILDRRPTTGLIRQGSSATAC